MPSVETITREDLTLFLNACFACTGQREFYDTAESQRVSIAFLHAYVCGNYRRLYARTLAAGINHFNQAAIVFNLLQTGKQTPAEFRDEENALLRATLRQLAPPRVFKLIARLQEEKVNNRRTRALLREYLAGRRDPAFDAIKYRRGVRRAAQHAHLPLAEELRVLLFGSWRQRRFTTPLWESFRQAHYAEEALYELPYTIAEGLAARLKVPRERFLKRIEPRLTDSERLRLQAASQGKLALDPASLSLTALVLWMLSLSPQERETQRARLLSSAQSTLRRMGSLPLGRGKLALILDNSYSASGSTEKKRRPLAIALAVEALLLASGREFRAFWTAPEALWSTRGQTNLTERLLDAVAWGAEQVIVVSDGVENDPPGVFDAALTAIQTQIRPVTVVQLNPVFDAEQLSVRALSLRAPVVGLRAAEDLATALGFVRFAAGEATLSELEQYLATRVEAFL